MNPTPGATIMQNLDLTGWERPDRGALFVVTGASGTGKTTLVRQAMGAIPHLSFSVSATTRAPRRGELDGRDYHFVSPERFQALLDQGAFLEWAEVYGSRYGTLRSPVEQALEQGDSILLDIDTHGAAQVRRRWPDPVTIFILPPSLSALEQRLRARSTDSEQVIQRRMEQVHSQLRACGDFDYLLVNDHLPAAHHQFQALLIGALLERRRRDSWVRRMAPG